MERSQVVERGWSRGQCVVSGVVPPRTRQLEIARGTGEDLPQAGGVLGGDGRGIVAALHGREQSDFPRNASPGQLPSDVVEPDLRAVSQLVEKSLIAVIPLQLSTKLAKRAHLVPNRHQLHQVADLFPRIVPPVGGRKQPAELGRRLRLRRNDRACVVPRQQRQRRTERAPCDGALEREARDAWGFVTGLEVGTAFRGLLLDARRGRHHDCDGGARDAG